jgi:prolyl oligopeptidase
MRWSLVGVALVSSVGALTASQPAAAVQAAVAAPAYPQTRRTDLVETQFGVPVADPYRWLEDDVRNNPEVRAWVDSQNAVTNAFLARLPGREALEQRITQLYDYERFAAPVKRSDRYFYTHNSGLQNQAVLFVRDRADGEGRVLIDANPWSKDGATALAEWAPNEQGTELLYAIQDGGTDWRTLKVRDVATGKDSADEIKWVKFSGLSWAKDGSGFYYSRFPEPKAAGTYQSLNENQQIYFHKLGTRQSADRLLFSTPRQPELNNVAQVSDDGRWLIVYSSSGTDPRYQVSLVDLHQAKPRPRVLIRGFDNAWGFVGNRGASFYFVTDKGAPRQKIVSLNVLAAKPAMRTIVAEDQATLKGATLVGGRIVADYLADAKSEVRVHALDGGLVRKVELPGIGTAGGFDGKFDDPETFFAFTSFNRPTTIYRYDVKTGAGSVWAAPKLAFNPEDYAVDQVFYPSKDGTRVPMFVVRKKSATGPAPTLLYGYGGFDISLTPSFSATRLAWLEQGGVYAVANQSAARAVRCRASRRRSDGHAALRPLHRGPLLGRRLRLPQQTGRFPDAARLFALSQHQDGSALSAGAGDDRRHRRSRSPGAQLQIYCGAAGGRPERCAAPHPDRNPRRPRLGQADRQDHRGSGRRDGFPRPLHRARVRPLSD